MYSSLASDNSVDSTNRAEVAAFLGMNADGTDRGALTATRAGALGLALAVLFGAACSASDEGGSQTTTTEQRGADGDASEPSNVFTDPEGTYEIRIGDEWVEQPGSFVAEVEAWAIGEPVDGFAPNVNVLTQEAPGMDLSQYLDVSAGSISDVFPDGEVIEARTVRAAWGGTLGILDYTGSQAGNDLHYLAVVAMANETAVVATLTAPESLFGELRAEVEPLMLTLRPLSS